MQKVIILIGIPGCGKSTFCQELMEKEPGKWKRINNDSLRAAIDFSVYSPENEKMICNLREHMLREFLKLGYNVLIDNLNIGKKHWDLICKIVTSLNKDICITEKPFYIDVEDAIERDSKREGISKVGETVIRKWFKKSGGKQHKFYNPRIEIFNKIHVSQDTTLMVQNKDLPKAVVFDNDGTISLLNGRNPYDASTCDNDLPHEHVIECMKLYANAGYKILFVSGREEKDRAPTERFYKKHFPHIEYQLLMRQTGDMRKDVMIKEEIFNTYIKNIYFVAGWFDDRLQIVKWLYKAGFPVFRVNDPEATF